MKDKAVFFDRDGVLNYDVNYLYKIADLRWMEGAREALAHLCQLGYKLFVVTNQSGIARGYFTEADMHLLHRHMQQELRAYGAAIEKFYYCPHYREGPVAQYVGECNCRKPKPGMILQAFAEYDLDREACFLVGDRDKDVQAAVNAGIRGYKFCGGNLDVFIRKILQEI